MSIINQVNVNGTTYSIKGSPSTSIFYGECMSDSSAVEKVVECPEFTSSDLVDGAMIMVLFYRPNTATGQHLTMNINNTGAQFITKSLSPGVTTDLTPEDFSHIMLFVYNGVAWFLINSPESDIYVEQNAAITSPGNYPVLLASDTSTDTRTGKVNKAGAFTYNPSRRLLQTGALGVASNTGYTTVVPTTTAGYTEGQVMFVLMDEE